MIETINKLVRTGRQMLHEIGREPTPEELSSSTNAFGKSQKSNENCKRTNKP